MKLESNLLINIYSIVLLTIVYLHSLKQDDKETLQHKLYIIMLQITILMLVVDIFSRFDGKPDTIYPIVNYFGNLLIFLINPIMPSIWLLYVYCQVFHEDKINRSVLYLLFIINAVNVIMVALSQFYGWLYYIDVNNIYHRGPLFFLSASITIALVLAAFVLILVNHERIDKKHYFSLVFLQFLRL